MTWKPTSGVQTAEWTLNNVALSIAFSCAEVIVLHCWGKKKPFIFLVGRYFTSKIRPPTPCWAYSLLFTGMTCTSFTTLLQFPQKLTVILQRLFHGSTVWTLSSTGVIALLLESCGWLVTSPVSRTSRNTALQRRGLLRLEWGGSANCR